MPHTCLHHDCERLLACPRQASACALCVTHSLCAPLCCPAVTGQHADDDQIEQMIESGESEMIFQKARARTGGGGGVVAPAGPCRDADHCVWFVV